MHFLRGKCGWRQRVLGWVPQEQRVPSGFAYLEIAVVIQTRREVVTCCWVNFQTATQIKILWAYMPWGSSFLPPTNKQMTFLRLIFVFGRKLLHLFVPKTHLVIWGVWQHLCIGYIQRTLWIYSFINPNQFWIENQKIRSAAKQCYISHLECVLQLRFSLEVIILIPNPVAVNKSN